MLIVWTKGYLYYVGKISIALQYYHLLYGYNSTPALIGWWLGIMKLFLAVLSCE